MNNLHGQFKIKGTKRNIIAFVENELYDRDNALHTHYLNGETFIYGIGYFRIKKTKIIITTFEYLEGDDIAMCNIIAGKKLSSQELLKLCKKYNVQIRTLVFNENMQYDQILDITPSKVLVDKLLTYKNYRWGSFNPISVNEGK